MDKSYTDLSYQPEWEHYHFDKEGYKKLFVEISSKEEDRVLLRYDHTIKVASLIENLWHQLLGLLGFEDRTNVIKVNYELLKILRYGENHHYFEDAEIRKVLTLTQKKLSSQHQYRRIGQIIGLVMESTLNTELGAEKPATLINHRIDLYYREHKSQLKEAFWPALFHKYVTPPQRDAALIHYNMGRIFLGEQNLEKAIDSFQNALAIDPDYPDCFLQLSRALLAHGENLHLQQNWEESFQLYDRTLKLLETINTKRLSPAESNDIHDLLIRTYLNKFSIEIKLEKFEEGIETLKKVAKASAIPLEQYFKTYFYQISPGSPLFPTDMQQARLLLRIVSEFPDFKTRLPYLLKAIELFERIAKTETPPPEVDEQMISALIIVAKGYLVERNYEKVEDFYNKAFEEYSDPKSQLSEKLKIEFSNEFFNGYQQLAYHLQNEANHEAAIRIYQQLKAMFPGNRLMKAKCCSEISRMESNDAMAWKEIEEACSLDPKEEYYQQQKSLAIKMADKAAAELQYAESEAFWKKVLTIDPENFEANRGMAFVHLELENDELAEHHLKKALALRPNDVELIYLKGMLHDIQGNFQEALESYLQAYKLDNHNLIYLKTLISASIKIGDRIYAKGSCRPENVQQSLVDFIEFVMTSSEAKKIEVALGAWKGVASQENKELQNLGLHVKTPDDVEVQGRRAIELIEKAYDGENNHLSPSELPVLFSQRMQILNQQISQMVAYYSSLREATVEFTTFVCHAEYYRDIETALGAWMGSSSSTNKEFRSLGKDATQLVQIEKEFKRSIEIVEMAYDGIKPHLPAHQMPIILREKIEAMRSLLVPTISANEAIPHYLRAYELAPNEYHDFLNRLIDSYFRINDHKLAVEWYEKLLQAFPNLPIRINPEAYLRVSEVLLNANKFTDAIKLINKAIELAPTRPLFRKALSHAYFRVAEGFQKKQNNWAKALEYYQKALGCGVEAEGACYASLADYYEKQVPLASTATIKGNLLEQITEYRKKAVEVEPANPAFNFQYARILYHEDLLNRTDPVPYLENAVALEPNNITYLYGLIMAKKRRGDNDSDLELVMTRFKSLGGNFATDYWEPIQLY